MMGCVCDEFVLATVSGGNAYVICRVLFIFNEGVSTVGHLRAVGVVGLYAGAMSSALQRAVL